MKKSKTEKSPRKSASKKKGVMILKQKNEGTNSYLLFNGQKNIQKKKTWNEKEKWKWNEKMEENTNLNSFISNDL